MAVLLPSNLKPAAAAKAGVKLVELGLVREVRAKGDMPAWREDEQGHAYSLKILKAGRAAVQAMTPAQEAASTSTGSDPSVTPQAIGETEVGAAKAGSKRAMILALLSREEGVTIDDLIAATGWLPHTTRAALSGLRKAGWRSSDPAPLERKAPSTGSRPTPSPRPPQHERGDEREACEAYIKSQAHEGWRLVPGHFDDGGLSGASLDRPALQRLLDEIRARRIDIVVVYKVDRLTRSLADFAKLVELFDAHGVSFVSVTQSFNTTSSMGRLTLNVLLSFAQFEREVIGERVRDKIAASKRKGLWVGGPLPLGYGSKDKVLFVRPEEAAAVRTIFERYLALKSVGALAADLRSRGITSRGGGFFGVGALAHLLRNRFYVGEVAYRGEIHPGPQEPIVDRAIFQAVQDGLDVQRTSRRARLATSSALLAGRLYDDRGNRLTPSHANKRGLRYRYYVSQAVLQNRKEAAGSVTRIAAPDLEEAVVNALRSTIGPHTELSDRELVERYLRSVVVGAGKVTMEIYETSMAVGGLGPSDLAGPEDDKDDATERPVRLHSIAWAPRQAGKAKSQHEDGRSCLSDAARGQLLLAIATTRRWMRDVAADVRSFEEIARQEGCGERHVCFLAPLAFLSPVIVTTIAEGRAPAGLTITSLVRSLPLEWATQESSILQ